METRIQLDVIQKQAWAKWRFGWGDEHTNTGLSRVLTLARLCAIQAPNLLFSGLPSQAGAHKFAYFDDFVRDDLGKKTAEGLLHLLRPKNPSPTPPPVGQNKNRATEE